MPRSLAALLASLALLLGVDASAGPLIHYQGVLLGSSGTPIDGAASVTFRLYDAASAGSQLWSEAHAVTADDGVFSVLLGSVAPIEPGQFDSGARWLELVVNGETMSPRQAIASVPRALNAERLQGLTVADLNTGGAVHVARTTQVRTLDTGGEAQADHTAVAIGSHGLPLIVYRDNWFGELRVVRCRSLDCASADPPTALALGRFGDYPSIAIGSDGNPLVVHRDYYNNNSLVLVRCTDATCTTTSFPISLDPGSDAGSFASLSIGRDGLPVVAYMKNDEPKLADCDDAECFDPTVSDLTQNDTDSLSLAMALDGRPLVAYHSLSDDRPHLIVCPASGGCDPPVSDSVIGSFAARGQGISLTIGDDGLPVVAYGSDAGQTYVSRCNNVGCTSSQTTQTIGAASGAEADTSISIGADGFPLVTFYDATAGDLKVVKCGSIDCATLAAPAIVLDGASSDAGRFHSMTMAPDGTPVISYVDTTSGAPRMLKCANAFCTPYWTRR